MIVVATDGACLYNPGGAGGWAWITEHGEFDSGGHPSTTNNIMELTAILRAITAHHRDIPLLIQSDSRYAINCVAVWSAGWEKNGWITKSRKPVANSALIRSIVAEVKLRTVEFEWVRGHSGHQLNEAADALAGAAAQGFS